MNLFNNQCMNINIEREIEIELPEQQTHYIIIKLILLILREK